MDGPYSQGYDYDVWGNVTHKFGWGGEVQGGGAGQSSDISYTYSGNRRTNGGFVYDAAGNVTSDTEQTYLYDATGQQTSASGLGVSWGAPPAMQDNPLKDPNNPESFKVKAVHITELRAAINALRVKLGLSNYSWTTSATTNDYISANPIIEMRTALNQALGPPPSPGYAAGLASGQPVMAVHIQELRNRVTTTWDLYSSSMTQAYDGNTLRVKKTQNGFSTYYLRSSVLGGQVVAELNTSGNWMRGYVYRGGSLLAVQQDGVYWNHEDPITKSRRVTDIYGNEVSRIELDPWGADTPRSSSAAFQPKKFTSYERDSNGSDDAMFRRYNRKDSRFVQPDPYDGSYDMTDPQSLNRYAYTQNDPVNFVDPTGLDDTDPLSIIRRVARPVVNAPAAFRAPTTYDRGESDVSGIFGSGDEGMLLEQLFGEQGVGGPQNTGHEFAHSTVRCPPTGKQLAGNPAVKKAINEAFKRADQFRKERGYWVEHGGWIYQDRKTGRISTFIKTPATSPPLPRDYPYRDYGTGVYLHSPPTRPGSDIVGVFHIHPENGAPNEYDDAAADRHKVPGVVGTPDGKTYQYGNYQRGIFGEGTPAHCR